MFGREVQLPIDLMYGDVRERFMSENQYAEHTKDVVEQAFDRGP